MTSFAVLMSVRTLRQLDVNLLVALDLLLRERHVTRAAAQLGVTQSAMSQTLARLRDAFEDPLLVRRGGTMVPTKRAEALEQPLRDALHALEHAVSEAPSFEPAVATRRFRLAMFDMATVTLLPRLVRRIAEDAPGVDLEVVPMDVERVVDWLRSEEVDAAIMMPRESFADVCRRPLFRDQLVSIVRDDHPISDDDDLTHAFASWPHATIRLTDRGQGSLDRALEDVGIERRVSLRVPYFLSAPALVCSSDLIFSLPRTAALEFASHWPIRMFAPPVPTHEFTVHLLWSRTMDADPAQDWFRSQIVAAAREVPGLVAGPDELAD